jgi:hypothetical protein
LKNVLFLEVPVVIQDYGWWLEKPKFVFIEANHIQNLICMWPYPVSKSKPKEDFPLGHQGSETQGSLIPFLHHLEHIPGALE